MSNIGLQNTSGTYGGYHLYLLHHLWWDWVNIKRTFRNLRKYTIFYHRVNRKSILRHTIEQNCTEIILYFSCCPNWSTSSLVGASYNWILILLGFIFPTCIIIFSNIFIMKKLQKVVSKWVDYILFSKDEWLRSTN